MNNRALDHLVLCVKDIEAARRFYSRMGFTLAPLARHPWGTVNSLVQLNGNFLELLAIAEPERIAAAALGSFSFGAYNADFLARRQGMSMLVFASDDARRDRAEFVASGLDTYAPFDFSRQATLPDGAKVTVGFSLAFVTEPRMPEAAFFVCQQHAPQHFWKPEYQHHRNGAREVTEILMVTPEPAALMEFFKKLQGAENAHMEDGALRVRAGRGSISVLDPPRFAERFPGAGGEVVRPTPRFAAFRIVCDLKAAEAAIEAGEIRSTRHDGAIQVAAAEAFGVAIEFAAG